MVTTNKPGQTLGSATPAPVVPTLPTELSPANVLEALGVAVYTTDADGVITYFNEAAAVLWGRRPEIGVDLWCGSWRIYTTDGELLPHDQCPMAITLKENREVRGVEGIAERPDGTRFNFLPMPTPLRDAHGRLIGAVNVLVDVTDRRRAMAEADRQRDLVRTITENMSVGLLMIDSEGGVEYMNPAAEVVTGYPFEEVRGQLFHEKIHPLHPDGTPFPREECLIDQANMSMQHLEGHEDVFVRPDGSFYNVICNVAPIVRHGQPLGAVIDLRDATEEKRAAEAIRQSMSLKDQFLGLVSHELRTPIATIVGNAILLLRRSETLNQEHKEQALADIAGESQKLQRIIENLLLITRMEAGKPLEAEPVRLPIAVNEAVAAFQRRSPKRTVSITTDGDVPIALGNAATLPLVFENLITNADKYSPLESPIEIRIYAGDEDDVQVCVRDYGIGIAANEVEDVFQPFYRSPRAKTHAAGIGLGLAVCRRVIEAQGGRIWAVARPEGGCDFIVSLNRAPES